MKHQNQSEKFKETATLVKVSLGLTKSLQHLPPIGIKTIGHVSTINNSSSSSSNEKNEQKVEELSVENMWNLIDRQINFPDECNLNFEYQMRTARRLRMRKSLLDTKKQRQMSMHERNSKAIRIFVSSTFTDFFSEREVLVKQVFPELREWCYNRQLDIIECDLRWGVPIESTSNETILTCMSELDRCYEDNDCQPFFIGMLGEKYGWVPDVNQLDPEVVQNYSWIPGASITCMEFVHGALRSKNKNACFMIRDAGSLSGIPAEYHEKFYETNALSREKLQMEKRKLKEYHPNQVFSYKCSYERIDESTGRKKVKLTDLDEFASIVLNYLKNAIDIFYPDLTKLMHDLDPTKAFGEVNNERIKMDDFDQFVFVNERTKFLISRDDELKDILKYVERDDEKEDQKEEKECENDDQLNDDKSQENQKQEPKKVLAIVGDEGCGRMI